ncbi:MAG: S-methyl-5-thioribose-1-phosphate isomerase [Actinomycetota bacterium]|nr:S-methyl-5-thioribose-1-phosphate isomerase [Actinomycetota bacterium]
MRDIRAVQWVEAPRCWLRLLDQTKLPDVEEYVDCDRVDQIVDAIQRLVVRGAPALGAVGALGVAVAMREGERDRWDRDRLDREVLRIRDARPTAVNLAVGVDRVKPLIDAGVDAVVAEALVHVAEDDWANRRLSALGADWILRTVGHRPVRVLTHCNTGSLATTSWGTGLGLVRELHVRGTLGLVYVDETRPLLQGSRLTSWELTQDGIEHVVQVDGAAASTILRGLADVAIVGADRIADNGDTANKIGSVGVALACADAGIPFVVAAPSTTVDPATASGEGIEIEMRPSAEVVTFAGSATAPADARGFNPAFDVTPARLIDAIVTEFGVVEPDALTSMRDHITARVSSASS